MNGDSLGDRMKSYEAVTRGVLLPHSYTILRVDGRAFHSYLRGAKKPFDEVFVSDMVLTALALCAEVQGTVFAYGQSDEISLLLADLEPQSQPWFGGVVQKMASVAAGVATLALIRERGVEGNPHFDARVFTLPSAGEVANYFIWRQRDAMRNSISMVAQAHFSQKQLHGKNGGQMQEMLFAEHGVNWNNFPDHLKRGWVVVPESKPGTVTYTDSTGRKNEVTVARRIWQYAPADHFTYGAGFLESWIPKVSQ